jgi:hypothetical protein
MLVLRVKMDDTIQKDTDALSVTTAHGLLVGQPGMYLLSTMFQPKLGFLT